MKWLFFLLLIPCVSKAQYVPPYELIGNPYANIYYLGLSANFNELWTDGYKVMTSRNNDSLWSAKENAIPTGTSSQYYRGDKTWQTMPPSKYLASFAISGAVNKIITAYMNNGDTVQTPIMKIPVTYSGTTNSSGVYAVTFPTAYSVAPNIQANVVGGNNKWTLIPTVTTTGFSIKVENRVDVLGLLPSYTNVNGANVDVIITEK